LRNGRIVFSESDWPRSEVSEFFEHSLAEIKKGLSAIKQETEGQAKASWLAILKTEVDYVSQRVVMVGGLVGSAYINDELRKWADDNGMEVSRPDGPT
jgi:hypothetical protein